MEKLNRRRSACVRDFTGANEKARDITFQTFPKSVTVQEKESVEIECEILGKPTSGKLHRISMPIEHDDPGRIQCRLVRYTRTRSIPTHVRPHRVIVFQSLGAKTTSPLAKIQPCTSLCKRATNTG